MGKGMGIHVGGVGIRGHTERPIYHIRLSPKAFMYVCHIYSIKTIGWYYSQKEICYMPCTFKKMIHSFNFLISPYNKS